MSEAPFRRVCRIEEIPEGEGITVELDGSELAIFRSGEQLWCTEGRCPHALACRRVSFRTRTDNPTTAQARYLTTAACS